MVKQIHLWKLKLEIASSVLTIAMICLLLYIIWTHDFSFSIELVKKP